jgi:purine-binding chemotaxis protein CheW
MTGPGEGEREVDVADVRRRVREVARAARAEGTMTPERAREILLDRARELATLPTRRARDDESLEVITFTLAGERFAIETRAIVEVFRLASLTTLPGAEPPVLGLTMWRGRLLTVLDLRAALGLPTAALNDMAFVIVLDGARAALGVLADAVHDVTTLATSDVHPLADDAERRLAVRGATPDATMVIDAARLARELGELTQGERTT